MTIPPRPAVEIVELRKRYPGAPRAAVDGLSLTIRRGEFLGLLGPNGAGKSTTIHCLTGIARPSGGTLRVFGTDVVSGGREARRRVGLSPQEFNVDYFTPIGKLLEYVAGYFGIRPRAARARAAEVLERFGLRHHAAKTFNELSGGLKRRTMLARAMIHDPELLILDEPTSGVDVELRHDLWRYMRELNGQGKTIILTSHYLDEVERLAGRVAILDGGRIVADAPKEELTRDGTLEEFYLRATTGRGDRGRAARAGEDAA